jgi:transcriptional regulator with XRE-family HTH domain
MPETIGQRLKQIRLSRQLSLEKAAESTRVRAIYLQALENDDYSAMSSAAQGRGFLRLYADFLGLDLEAAMTEMRQAETPAVPSDATPLEEPAKADAPPAPELQTPPASPADDKPVRRGFWSRLLRRAAPEPLPESASEAVTPPALPVATEPEPVLPKPPRPTRAKTPTAKKTTSSAKKDKPKAKATVKPAGKKKLSLKNQPKR